MGQTVSTVDLDSLSEDELDALERRIAGKYMHMVPWGAVAWGLLNLLVWLSLFPLVMLGLMPLWLAFPIAVLNVMLCYLPSHEAQHNIIGRQGGRLRWLNELVGQLSPIPLGTPYRVLKHTHLEHHAHTNDAGLDPDYSVHAASNKDFFWRSLMNRQPGSTSNAAYANALERVGKSHMLLDALVLQLIYLAVLFALAWSGYALEAVLLWWLPRQIGLTYIQYYLSWAPHRPGQNQDRYGDTRAFKSALGNLWSMGMQYHIVHHLYPRIPLSLTPAAYRELRPILARRGCELGGM